MRKLVYLPLLIILILNIFIDNGEAKILKRDDFQDKKTWWDWGARCTSSPSVHDGLAFLVQNQGYSNQDCGTYLWDEENIYQYYTANIRVKTLTPMRPGTRGWGFWDYDPLMGPYEQVDTDFSWFMQQYDPFDSYQSWWLGGTKNGETLEFSFTSLDPFVDIEKWHTYKIERRADYVALYVDGVIVHFSDSALPEGLQSFHLWIDNFIYPFDPYSPITYRNINDPSSLIVDFIEIYEDQLGESAPPAGSLLLKEIPNETGNGSSNYLWKEFNFYSPGGVNLVIITGRVESYNDFSDDDDIRIVIDDIDLEWDTETSFNGEEINGQNSSLIYIDNFNAGEHYLDIYGDITPILYDVTVIGAENGDIILYEELDEEAPGGSNLLWKDYSFNCTNNEEVTVFISASAHENTGDDDDIRIVLNDEDFGWDTDYSFSGDRLHGEARAITIRRDLLAGEHRLRIYAEQTPILHNVIIYGSEELSVSNWPPLLGPIGNKAVNEGELLEFTITATDPDGGSLTLSAGNLPSGASFDAVSQQFSWTPAYGQAGSYANILFTVTDDGNPPQSDSEAITITVGDVNRLPVLDPIGNKAVNEGELLEFTITATDPDGGSLTFSAGNLPSGASFDAVSQQFSWAPAYGQAGSYANILFTVTDDGNPPQSDSEAITITLGDVNRLPVLDPIGNKAVNEEDLLEFTITATDPDGGSLTFSAGNLPSGASFDAVSQQFSWAPAYGQAGSYANILFTVTDDGNPPQSDSEAITITLGDVNRLPVLDPIGNKAVNEGELLEFTITATDPDGGSLTFSAGNLPSGASFDAVS